VAILPQPVTIVPLSSLGVVKRTGGGYVPVTFQSANMEAMMDHIPFWRIRLLAGNRP
jgi:hypothetical protein